MALAAQVCPEGIGEAKLQHAGLRFGDRVLIERTFRVGVGPAALGIEDVRQTQDQRSGIMF